MTSIILQYNNLKKGRFSYFCMKECYICGIGEDKSVLYDGISEEGVVSICRKCYLKNDIPLVEKKTSDAGFERRTTVRERLSSMAGLDKRKINFPEKKDNPQDENLKKIIEKNFKENLPKEKISYEDLVDNFHWAIMMKRRSKKLSQEQFAQMIFEPVIVVEHLEKGKLPKDYYQLLRKVERILEIKLFKDQNDGFEPSRIVGETKMASGITISDLKKYQEQNSPNSEEILEKPKKRKWFFFKKKKKEIPEEVDEESEE